MVIEKYVFGHSNGVNATINVLDSRFYGEIAFGGSIGAGEAYMLGYWTADNLTNVIRLMCVNPNGDGHLKRLPMGDKTTI